MEKCDRGRNDSDRSVGANGRDAHANFRGKRKKKKKKKRKNTSAHLHANHVSIRVDCVTHTIMFLRTRFGLDAENVTQDRRNKK